MMYDPREGTLTPMSREQMRDGMEDPKKRPYVFAAGEFFQLKEGFFRIKSVGQKMMLVEPVPEQLGRERLGLPVQEGIA